MTAFSLVPGGWIDPFDLVCSLRPRMGWFKEPTDFIRTTGDRVLRITPKVIEKWPELGNALEAVEAIGQGQYERGETRIEMVEAGASVLIPATGTVLMVLRTNPLVTVAGPQQAFNPAVTGDLIAVSAGMCVMNMGTTAWAGLLVEARRTASQ